MDYYVHYYMIAWHSRPNSLRNNVSIILTRNKGEEKYFETSIIIHSSTI